jgi:hypothetical protein
MQISKLQLGLVGICLLQIHWIITLSSVNRDIHITKVNAKEFLQNRGPTTTSATTSTSSADKQEDMDATATATATTTASTTPEFEFLPVKTATSWILPETRFTPHIAKLVDLFDPTIKPCGEEFTLTVTPNTNTNTNQTVISAAKEGKTPIGNTFRQAFEKRVLKSIHDGTQRIFPFGTLTMSISTKDRIFPPPSLCIRSFCCGWPFLCLQLASRPNLEGRRFPPRPFAMEPKGNNTRMARHRICRYLCRR